MTKKKIEESMPQLDRLPREAGRAADIERTASAIAAFYGFEEIALSPIEQLGTLLPAMRAGLMDEWPPVRIKASSGEELLLSPSGVIGAIRAYFSHRLQDLPHPLKLFFRGRGFSQACEEGSTMTSRDEWGVVVIGEESAVAETGIAQVFYRAATELGIGDASIELRLNAIGCAACRTAYRTSLGSYFRRHLARLCRNSKRDLKRSPTRILSCTDERCRGAAGNAPQVLDFLCERCKKQLRSLLEFLDEARIPYFLDPKFFRDGSWYTEMIFELLIDRVEPMPVIVSSTQNGAEGVAIVQAPESAPEESIPARVSGGKRVLAEGGRVSHAAFLIGGKEVAIAAGILFPEAIAAAIARQEALQQVALDVFFAQLGELAKRRSFEILEVLREAEIEAKESLGRDSIKTQLKIAERLGARFAVILGQKEALDGTIIVREIGSGIQETIPQDRLVDFLKKKLKK